MIKAIFLYKRKRIYEMEVDKLTDFPVKGAEFSIEGESYKIKEFSLMEGLIIYFLEELEDKI